MRGLFLLFLIVPMLEMWLLIKVGQLVGAWQTIGLVALTAVIGISLLKRQGLHTLLRVQERLNSGQIPATELLEGLLLAIGGALLLTPGFVTDAFGFCCLLPLTRRWLASKLMNSGMFVMSQASMGATVDPFNQQQFQHRHQHEHRRQRQSQHSEGGQNVIEGECDRVEK